MFISKEKQLPYTDDGYYKSTTDLHLNNKEGWFAKGSLIHLFKKNGEWYFENDNLTVRTDDIEEDIFSEEYAILPLVKTEKILKFEEDIAPLKKEVNEYKDNYVAKLGWLKKRIFITGYDDDGCGFEVIASLCAVAVTCFFMWLFGFWNFLYEVMRSLGEVPVGGFILLAALIVTVMFAIIFPIFVAITNTIADRMCDDIDQGRKDINSEIDRLYKECLVEVEGCKEK